METKLKELTDRLYQDGIERAKSEAEKILAQAARQAAETISQAQTQAEGLLVQAQKDSEKLKAKVTSELTAAAQLSSLQLRRSLTETLSHAVLAAPLEQSFSDQNFMQDLILALVQKWQGEGEALDLSVILGPQQLAALDHFFATRAKTLLDAGMVIKTDQKMQTGFKIIPQDGSYVLSFTEKDFEQLFLSYLGPRAKEILFPEGLCE